jgi:thioredoxin-dependent adenylylsulfate APS reductase
MTDLDRLQYAPAEELLRWAIETFRRRLAIVTSFQREGMVIVDMAARISSDIRVLTIDTGRVPPETYEMIERLRERYRIPIEIIMPEASEVEAMVTRFGPNLFYESVALRSLCCHFRKVRPLERKLEQFDAWVVGVRREQSESRESVAKVETVNGRFKLSPLADWTAAQVSDYTKSHDVPEHPLYARGYASIGCGPCTRATEPGEDERAGRWWWEQNTAKECGLHFSPEGRVERTLDVLVREILKA